MTFYKKNIQVNKNKYILRIIIVFIYIISLFLYKLSNQILYFRMLEIMNIIFSGLIIVMVNSKYSRNSNSSSILGSGFIVIIVLYLVKFIIADYSSTNILTTKESVSLELSGILINFCEILVIVLTCRIRNAKKYKNYLRENIILLLITLAGIIFFISNIHIVNLNIKNIYYGTRLNYIIFLTLYIYCYISLLFSEIKFNSKQRKTLVFFITMSLFGDLINGFSSTIVINENYSYRTMISYALDYFSYYFLYECFIINSLEEYYNSIYRSILRRERKIKKRNMVLNNRTQFLNELNMLVKRSKKHHNEFINSINEFICIFKGDKIKYINNGALNLISDNFSEDYLKEMLYEFYNSVIKSKKKKSLQYKFQLMLTDRFGKQIDLELFYITLQDDYIFIFIKNITTENEIKKEREKLRAYYEEEYLKREFFSNISHELRTPINVISAAIQLNEVSIEEGNLELVKKNNDRIRQNSLRLIRTINNFIDVNRIANSYIRGEFKLYNIVDLVETILHRSKEYIYKKEMNFIFDTEEEEVYIKIDRNFTERVILNILSNCVKYGNKGGNIYINIIVVDNEVKINIENDGKLISDEEKAYIFDKFTKNNKAFNRTNEGSGLGLYISKSLMELQGGSLGIIDDENNKNIFVIRFKKELTINENLDINEVSYSEISMRDLKERVDIEFADIYL